MVSQNSNSSNPLSPSLSSMTSFDTLSSLRTNSNTSEDVAFVASDDEIVWGAPEDSLSEFSEPPSGTDHCLPASDDNDFVVLSWASRKPTPSAPNRLLTNAADLSAGLQRLSLNGQSSDSRTMTQGEASTSPKSSKRKKGRKSNPAKILAVTVESSYASPVPTPMPERQASTATFTSQPSTPTPTLTKSKSQKHRAVPEFGARPIVDEMSEQTSEIGDVMAVSWVYEDAANYITTFLTNPTSRDRTCRLTLLQALIIELGLCAPLSASPPLPSSLRAAKALIKSNAFLNIREYIAVRHQGLTALQRVMYPSRRSLLKDIRKNKSATSLKWVKENGLQVLLVSPYH